MKIKKSILAQIIIAGPRYLDSYIRCLMANIKSEKMVYKRDLLEATNHLDLNGIDKIFILHDISLIYMGTMSERSQEIVIEKLKPYKSKIEELIEKGQVFLFTGNSIEVLGEYVENEDGSRIEALGIFKIYAKRNMLNRHNSFFLGMYNNIELLGFKSQFTMLYGENSQDYFATVTMGIGINEQSKFEGIKKNNFIATYVIGPLLILNPIFTIELLKMMGVQKPKLAFEEEVLKAYQLRLNKFKTLKN